MAASDPGLRRLEALLTPELHSALGTGADTKKNSGSGGGGGSVAAGGVGVGGLGSGSGWAGVDRVFVGRPPCAAQRRTWLRT